MNINDALLDSAARLAAAGVPNARREAGTLLAFALERQTVFLMAHPEYELSAAECARYAEVVHRRVAREPFHLITGSREFFGRDFLVEKGVLLPRPETEILVEQAIALLSATKDAHIFEVGVGTGCISVSILKELPTVFAEAVDISVQALALAGRNAARHEVLDRLLLGEGDLFDHACRTYDMIISNPPYIPDRHEADLAPEVSRFDPPTALFSGDDGLDLIRRIVDEAPNHLTSAGHLLLEIGAGQASAVRKLLGEDKWSDVVFARDLQGIPRVVRAKRRSLA